MDQQSERKRLGIAVGREALDRIQKWLSVKRRCFKVALRIVEEDEPFDLDGDAWLESLDLCMAIGPACRAPSRALPGCVLRSPSGRKVLTSWIPDSGSILKSFEGNAEKWESRLARPVDPVLFLGQWDDRSQRVAQRSERCLDRADTPIEPRVWTADRVTLAQLRLGLQCGAGLAFYYGHGRSKGWAAYHGFRAKHVQRFPEEPLGVLVSPTCDNAKRGGQRYSFAEQLLGRGAIGLALAATERSLHIENAWIASALCEQLAAGGVERFCELFERAAFPEDITRSRYRLLGDLTLPLGAAPGARERADAIYAPAPSDEMDWERLAASLRSAEAAAGDVLLDPRPSLAEELLAP